MNSEIVLTLLKNILLNSGNVFTDAQNIVSVVKAAREDGHISADEAAQIAEAVLTTVKDVALLAFDVAGK